MSSNVNTRELILETLLLIDEAGEPSHIALGNVLAKYQFLPRTERAFITRVCEGTLEYRLRLDYILDHFSSVPTEKMKPVIREILRSAVYQMEYMDHVPDSAVCNEAVALTQRKGFYHLKGFVNGVLRTVARERKNLVWPDRKDNLCKALSIQYSMPEFLISGWFREYGADLTEQMLIDFLSPRKLTVRFRTNRAPEEEIMESLQAQGVTVSKAPYLSFAYTLSGIDHLYALDAFSRGWIAVQDISSMLVGSIAAPQKGDHILDLCAAPGGKSLLLGDLMDGYGMVEARDLSEYKVGLIEDNIARLEVINVQTKVQDATVFDVDAELGWDIVLADVPCSGYGVIGRKPEIKYRANANRQSELVDLQRRILSRAAEYVRPRGVLIYSTCTIAREENEENRQWILEHFPFVPESLNPYLPKELIGETTSEGYLQLLPGIHETDGFFMARFRRK